MERPASMHQLQRPYRDWIYGSDKC